MQIFCKAVQIEGFHWVVYPTLWRLMRRNKLYCRAVLPHPGEQPNITDNECPQFD
jgi:hypothetical protein